MRVDDLEPAAAHEDRAAAAALRRLAGGVAVGEGQVLHGQLGVVLVLAVRRRPALGLVAGVHVEDPALAATAEGDHAAAVEHDLGAGVVHDLGGLVIVIVIGSGPQSKVMMPPGATASTTAAEVHVAGVPSPMTGRVRGVDGRGLGRDDGAAVRVEGRGAGRCHEQRRRRGRGRGGSHRCCRHVGCLNSS